MKWICRSEIYNVDAYCQIMRMIGDGINLVSWSRGWRALHTKTLFLITSAKRDNGVAIQFQSSKNLTSESFSFISFPEP